MLTGQIIVHSTGLCLNVCMISYGLVVGNSPVVGAGCDFDRSEGASQASSFVSETGTDRCLQRLFEQGEDVPRATAIDEGAFDEGLLSVGSGRQANAFKFFQCVIPADRANDRLRL